MISKGLWFNTKCFSTGEKYAPDWYVIFVEVEGKHERKDIKLSNKQKDLVITFFLDSFKYMIEYDCMILKYEILFACMCSAYVIWSLFSSLRWTFVKKMNHMKCTEIRGILDQCLLFRYSMSLFIWIFLNMHLVYTFFCNISELYNWPST